MGSVNGRKRVLGILCILCLAGAVFCIAEALRELIPRAEAERVYGELRREAFKENDNGKMTGTKDVGTQNETALNKAIPNMAVRDAVLKMPDWNALRERNADICGWIYGPGTSIDYPVVQGADNTWYLNHTVDGKKNAAGAIFMEHSNQRSMKDDITVLYGHHIRGGRMFSSLSGYKDQNYYDKHPCFYLYTAEVVYRVELFAGNVINGGSGGFPLQFSGDEERREWIAKTVRESTFKSRTKPQDGERILALCTCSYEYQDARFVVYGTLEKLEMAEDSRGTD